MSEKRFELILIKYNGENDVDESWLAIKDNETDKMMQDVETVELLNTLHQENTELKRMIKANVLKHYRDGSLADLQFKAIAYDDITQVEMDYTSEPILKIYCKPNTRQNIQSFIQLFVPLGVYFEVIDELDDCNSDV